MYNKFNSIHTYIIHVFSIPNPQIFPRIEENFLTINQNPIHHILLEYLENKISRIKTINATKSPKRNITKAVNISE